MEADNDDETNKGSETSQDEDARLGIVEDNNDPLKRLSCRLSGSLPKNVTNCRGSLKIQILR